MIEIVTNILLLNTNSIQNIARHISFLNTNANMFTRYRPNCHMSLSRKSTSSLDYQKS